MQLEAVNAQHTVDCILLSTSLPVGWQDRKCPNCSGDVLRAALITPSADEQDPDIICTTCRAYF
jgi:hypothetical protein